MPTRLATPSRNAAADAVAGQVASIEIRSGAQPATPQTAASGTLLATVPLTFGAAANGAATAADPAAVDPTGTGSAGWFRALDATSGAVFDGTVTVTGGGGDLTLSNVSLAPGISVDITSFTYTQPAG